MSGHPCPVNRGKNGMVAVETEDYLYISGLFAPIPVRIKKAMMGI